MEDKDNRRQDEHRLLGVAGDESPVLAIAQLPETPSEEEHNRDQEDVAQTASTNTDETNLVCDDDADFEFAFASSESDLPAIRPADEIFSEGRMRPIYPVFDRGLFQYYQSLAKEERRQERPVAVQRQRLRDLMMQQRQDSISREEETKTTRSSIDAGSSPVALARTGSCSSSDGDELEGVPEESYCLWTPGSVPPSPDNLGRKSRSTGSSGTRRWRLCDLVLGRSHSDGRQKLMFFQHDDAEPSSRSSSSVAAIAGSSTSRREDPVQGENKGSEEKTKGKNDKKPPTTKKKTVATKLDMATAHRLFYRNNSLNTGVASAAEANGQRRPSSTFLPHRKDMFVGIFPHARSPGRGDLRSSSFYGF